MNCGDREAAPRQPGGPPRVATLSPAATDLLIGMGAAQQLVAVSNFDAPRDPTRDLPRVGDYEQTDWEQLGSLRPDVMVVQIRPEKLPPGFSQRAEKLGIRLANIRINRLDDVLRVVGQLGEACGRENDARKLAARLTGQFESVKAQVAGSPPVRTLMVLDADGTSIVGANTFLDDLLTMAGGQNVARSLSSPYPSIDREQLLELSPDAVLVLLPGATENVLKQSRQFWSRMGTVPAAKSGRVHMVTDWFVLLPGAQTGEVARKFAALLHPEQGARP